MPTRVRLVDDGALIIPLPRDAFPDVRQPVTVAGLRLEPKNEFHVTLANAELRSTLRRALGGRGDAETRIAGWFDATDWSWRDTGERWLLRRADPDTPPAHSIVTLVDMPGVAAFRHRLARASGIELPEIPAHVTLYTAGDPGGIGLASHAQFLERRILRIG
jgi:hypothetical protein